MGSSMSKSAGDVARRYPSRAGSMAQQAVTRAPPPTPPSSSSSPAVSSPRASATKSQAIVNDGRDPDMFPPSADAMPPPSFSARLHELGIVTPAPGLTLRPSAATSFPGAAGFAARKRLENEVAAAAAAGDTGKGRGKGKGRMVDIETVVKAVRLREQGVADGDVETRLGLERGTAGRLGGRGVVEWVRPGEGM